MAGSGTSERDPVMPVIVPVRKGARDMPGLTGKLEENQAGVVYQNITKSRSHPSAMPVNREMAMMARTWRAIRAGLA